MEIITKLLEIADFLDLKNIAEDINRIKERSSNEDAQLLFPLVGEFSAGKTTLINALTESKKLETATKPTTSTIYKINFGSDKCFAKIINNEGESMIVEDISELKNEDLGDIPFIEIFDTSNKVSKNTVIVDTPGLSSSNPVHKKSLVSFLPYADGIFLVIDVNQQITRSLTEFVEDMRVSERPIYVIITKSDTKSAEELKDVKKYISENSKLPIENMICVSATKNELNEFYQLLDHIQKQKNQILKKVDTLRVKNITKTMIDYIDEVIDNSKESKDLDNAIREQDYELRKLLNNINNLLDEARSGIKEKEKQIIRDFEDTLTEKLNGVLCSNGNYDQQAKSAISNLTVQLLSRYQNQIREVLGDIAKKNIDTDKEISLDSIESLDLSNLNIDELNYNLNLDILGKEYNKHIATGIKVVGAIALIATAGAAGAKTAATTGAKALEVADIATDVVNTASNISTVSKIRKFMSNTKNIMDKAQKIGNKVVEIDTTDRQLSQKVGVEEGFIEGIVGWGTDKFMGKPQRMRAIRKFIEEVTPDFKEKLEKLDNELMLNIKQTLNQEAEQKVEQRKSYISKLKKECSEQKELYKQRINQLKTYKKELLNI